MSKYSEQSRAEGATVTDYDRQFQKDLERAQALSLESLALEKFRQQKLQNQGPHRNDAEVDPIPAAEKYAYWLQLNAILRDIYFF